MSRRLPPLNSLRVFEAAARHSSFTRASEELYVTQAAVRHQIKALEEYLGIKLFRRQNRALFLTEEGQSYFLDIKDTFSSLVDATERLLARGAKGSLTVSLQPSFAIQWLVPRLSLFAELYPDIDVRIKAVDMDDGSLTDDVDARISRKSWPVPPIFDFLQKHGNVDTQEMFRVFNMGIGYVIVVRPHFAESIAAQLRRTGETVFELGKIVKGAGKLQMQ